MGKFDKMMFFWVFVQLLLQSIFINSHQLLLMDALKVLHCVKVTGRVPNSSVGQQCQHKSQGGKEKQWLL